MKGYLIFVHNLNSIEFFALSTEPADFLSKFYHVLWNCLLPNKSIFVGNGLNLCSVNKNIFTGYFPEIQQDSSDLCHYRLCTLWEMDGNKSGYCRMIRCGRTIEKVHEIDISFTGWFNITTGIDSVHCRIDCNLKHLTWCCLIFPDSVISGI